VFQMCPKSPGSPGLVQRSRPSCPPPPTCPAVCRRPPARGPGLATCRVTHCSQRQTQNILDRWLKDNAHSKLTHISQCGAQSIDIDKLECAEPVYHSLSFTNRLCGVTFCTHQTSLLSVIVAQQTLPSHPACRSLRLGWPGQFALIHSNKRQFLPVHANPWIL
jgi:hypothetical protein